MNEYKYTAYFENEVLRKRPYENPIRVDTQDDDRVRFWGRVEEFDDRILRVVTLDNRVTIHNAFLDSNFKL